ncbi:MAG: hypothetical protein V7641_159 [Blastocatellia bacterium]
MAKPILITGSTGTVGSEVVKQLAATGATIRAAVQATSNTENILRAGAEPFEMNFADFDSMRAALEGVDKAFLITPVIPDQSDLTAGFVAAARAARLKHIVKLSVLGVDSEADFLFGKQHRQSERDIVDSEIAFTFLRSNFFMQNFLGLTSIKAQGAFYDSSGDAKASHVDVRDIAAIAVAALNESGHEGKIYDITGSEALSNFEIANILSSVTGKQITYVPVSDDDARQSMQAAGMPEWLVEALIELIQVKRAGYLQAISTDVEPLLGRKPIDFEQFARDYIEAFK